MAEYRLYIKGEGYDEDALTLTEGGNAICQCTTDAEAIEYFSYGRELVENMFIVRMVSHTDYAFTPVD